MQKKAVTLDDENVDSCHPDSAQTKLTVCAYLFVDTSSLCSNLTGAFAQVAQV